MSATATTTTREIADYLAKQQQKGWPGSESIHPLGRRPWLRDKVPLDLDGAYRLAGRFDAEQKDRAA